MKKTTNPGIVTPEDKSDIQRLQHLNLIKKGWTLLKNAKQYKDINIIRKLEALQYNYSHSLYSRILLSDYGSLQTLKQIASGIQDIVKSELGLKVISGEFSTSAYYGWKEKSSLKKPWLRP